MERRQVAEILGKISYKPNWKFEIINESKDWVVVNVASDYVQDIHSPFEKLRIQIQIEQAIVLSLATEGSIKALLGHMIKRIEDHEFEEWFKFAGNCVRQPHK